MVCLNLRHHMVLDVTTRYICPINQMNRFIGSIFFRLELIVVSLFVS